MCPDSLSPDLCPDPLEAVTAPEAYGLELETAREWLPPAPVPPEQNPLAAQLRQALETGQRTMLEVSSTMTTPTRILPSLLSAAVEQTLRTDQRVLVVLADQASLDLAQLAYLLLLARKHPDLSWTPISQVDHCLKKRQLPTARLVLTTCRMLAWHLELLERSDLELLPMPDCVIFERADETAARVRRAMARRVTLPWLVELQQVVASCDELAELSLHLELLVAALEAGLRAGRWLNPVRKQLTPGALPLGGLAELLEQAAPRLQARGLEPVGEMLGFEQASRVRMTASLLRALASPDPAFEVRAVWEGPHPGIERRPSSVGAVLSAGLLDHVRAVVGVTTARRVWLDRFQVLAELGLADGGWETLS